MIQTIQSLILPVFSKFQKLALVGSHNFWNFENTRGIKP